MLQAPINLAVAANFAVRDDFTQTTGDLNGKTATVGGTWTAAAGTFRVIAATQTCDTNVNDGPDFAFLGVSATNSTTIVEVDLDPAPLATPVGGDTDFGAGARRVDASNWLWAGIRLPSVGGTLAASRLVIVKRVAGVNTTIATIAAPDVQTNGGTYRITLDVTAAGFATAFLHDSDGRQMAVVSAHDSVLATGGALASGTRGMYVDENGGTDADTQWSQFRGWSAEPDAVMYASQSAELATIGITREDSSGSAYGPVSIISGDLPRIPNASSGGTVEVFLKASRGDMESLPDPAMDDISARVYQRPCWLYTPE